MKKHQKITLALATATCSLIGGLPNAQAEISPDYGDWDVNAALLFYSEADRVKAIEPVISAKKQIDTDETVSLKLVLDSLTGASANGAVSTNIAQTFTRPSGNGTYTTSANETPLDDTFHDTRVAVSASWEMPLSRMDKLVLGGNISNEYDYTSIGVSSLFSRDINERNTTLSAGLSFASDSISPEGGTPNPFSEMLPAGDAGYSATRVDTSESKTTIDVLFGITQVIDKNSLLQFNYSFSQADGYLTDPFKVISVVDATTGIPIDYVTGVAIVPGTTLSQVVYENRPDSRTKHSMFTQYKRNFSGDVFDISYRYMFDDWEINSHTVDFKYRLKTSETTFWQPHVRFYQQSEAEFYKPYYLSGSQPTAGSKTEFATADYRLGEMNTMTLGIEYGHVYEDHGWSFAAEYYLQTSTEPDNKVGELNNQELSPDVDAFMLRFNYDF